MLFNDSQEKVKEIIQEAQVKNGWDYERLGTCKAKVASTWIVHSSGVAI